LHKQVIINHALNEDQIQALRDGKVLASSFDKELRNGNTAMSCESEDVSINDLGTK